MIRQIVSMLKDPSLLSSGTSRYSKALMKVKRFAEILLHQQLWFFGKDITNAKSNLLIDFGFKRIRPPKETDGSTNYICHINGESSLVLWGFGVYYVQGNNPGVYLGRYNVYPKLIHGEPLNLPIWSPSSLPEMSNPKSIEEWECSFRLMSELFDWIACYEGWVNWVMDLSYRENCLKDFKQPIVSCYEGAWAWNRMANFFRQQLVSDETSNKTLFLSQD